MNYRSIPESEKIPLRITMATRIYLDMLLLDGLPVAFVERAQLRLADKEQYSGAEGAKRALSIFKLPFRRMKIEYAKIVDATRGYEHEPFPEELIKTVKSS